MVKQLFYDCVNGIKIENIGLGDPISPQIDTLIDHCIFIKQFNTGVHMSGVSLGSSTITNCTFEKCSFGIFIEEVKSYGNFSKYYDKNDINLSNIKMNEIRLVGIVIRNLISILRMVMCTIKTLKKTPITMEHKKQQK